MDTSFLTWYPFPAPFLGKGAGKGYQEGTQVFGTCPVEKEGTQVFLRKTLYLFNKWLTKKTFLKQKMQSLCLFKKWLTKKTFLKQKMLRIFCQVCIFCFKKVFFVNHFLKRYKLCVVALPSNTIFVRKTFPVSLICVIFIYIFLVML